MVRIKKSEDRFIAAMLLSLLLLLVFILTISVRHC
jgi:hypothetical protein